VDGLSGFSQKNFYYGTEPKPTDSLMEKFLEGENEYQDVMVGDASS
jgi:hypothetical protein